MLFYFLVCGGNLTGEYGTIQSPNYPNIYPRNRDCRWVLTGPPGQTISLTFSSINYGLENSASCNYDYIELRNGSSATDSLLGKFCGTNVPGRVTTTGNSMYVHFHSDGSQQFTGFQATWQACKFIIIRSMNLFYLLYNFIIFQLRNSKYYISLSVC